jgi:hypothetical protein
MSPSHGPGVTAITDGSGHYELYLSPGVYKVQASMDVWQFLGQNGSPHRPIVQASAPRAVWIVSNTRVRADLGIYTQAA